MTMLIEKAAIRLIVLVCLVAPLVGAAQVPESTNAPRTIRKPGQVVETPGVTLADIQLSLSFPAGKSPKVFTRGWVFGAVGVEKSGTRGQRDISGEVRWKGTGTFQPDRGPVSRPIFNAPGTNQITLYVERGGKVVFEKTFTVEAVDSGGYVSVGGKVFCPHCSHGCPACPHPVNGVIASGSPNVLIDGVPAVRVGDSGTHAACCGSNTFVVKSGDTSVLIDGKPAARVGDQTQHCGGLGKIVSAGGKG